MCAKAGVHSKGNQFSNSKFFFGQGMSVHPISHNTIPHRVNCLQICSATTSNFSANNLRTHLNPQSQPFNLSSAVVLSYILKSVHVSLCVCLCLSVCLSVSRLKGFWMRACRKSRKVPENVKKFTEGHVTIFEEFGS